MSSHDTSTGRDRAEDSDGTATTAVVGRLGIVVVRQNGGQDDPVQAAMTVAETVELRRGQRWRLSIVHAGRTTIIDVPLASKWIAGCMVPFIGMFGRRAAMIDWNRMPQRIRFVEQAVVAKSEQELLIERIADLMWANRTSIRVTGTAWTPDMQSTTTEIQLADGVSIAIRTKFDGTTDPEGRLDHQYTLTASGVVRALSATEAEPIDTVWNAIVCQAFLDHVEPGHVEIGRRSDSKEAATRALCRHIERHEPERHHLSYQGYPSKYEYKKVEMPSRWWAVAGDAIYGEGEGGLWDRPVSVVSDGRLGMIQVDRTSVLDAESRRARRVVECAIACTPPPLTGASETGSPKAAILARLLRDSIDRWPDLADAGGTPIEPLLSRHLPRLLKAYVDERSLSEDSGESARADLESGLERITAALEEALSLKRDRRRDDLRTEVAFLRSRHPDREFATIDDLP